MSNSVINREGFWYSKHEPLLPKPIENEKAWKGKKKFIEALKKKEEKAKKSAYRGWSTCRICQSKNGSTEYELDNWIWPVGYLHYIKEHNVRPSLAFQEFILGHQLK